MSPQLKQGRKAEDELKDSPHFPNKQSLAQIQESCGVLVFVFPQKQSIFLHFSDCSERGLLHKAPKSREMQGKLPSPGASAEFAFDAPRGDNNFCRPPGIKTSCPADDFH